jgi:hypothetical protein
MPDDTILMLCAIHRAALALFYVGLWRTSRWPQALQQATLANRAIAPIVNIQLI